MVLNDKDYNRLIDAIRLFRDTTKLNVNVKNLADGLREAQVIPSSQTPADLVTMNSRILLKRLDNNQEITLSIVYHNDADLKEKKISIFAPMGASLLGAKEQQIVDCSLPAGNVKYQISKLLYQPEAAGDHHL